jgi:Rrf2 family iron-sulfur cluster assembly transcriptional regulator
MFTISTQVRYALRALARIALSDNHGFLPLASIAKDENLSIKYLEHIFRQLKKNGIVESSRGPDGGYRLTRDTRDITLYEIVAALEGPVSTVTCATDELSCERSALCSVKHVWSDMQDHIVTFLEGRTLETVLQYEHPFEGGPSHG